MIEAPAAIVLRPIGAAIAPPGEELFRIGFVHPRQINKAAKIAHCEFEQGAGSRSNQGGGKNLVVTEVGAGLH